MTSDAQYPAWRARAAETRIPTDPVTLTLTRAEWGWVIGAMEGRIELLEETECDGGLDPEETEELETIRRVIAMVAA